MRALAVLIGLGLVAAPPRPLAVPKAYASLETTYKEVAGPLWAERAAQGWAESGFNAKAVSPVGAMGTHQFMPGTWKGGQRQGWIPKDADPFDPIASIKAGHIYMNQIGGMVRSWLGPCSKDEEWAASLCGYNAGPGNAKKAIWLAKEAGLPATEWKRMLPSVTGKNSAETLTYIPNNFARRDFLLRMK